MITENAHLSDFCIVTIVQVCRKPASGSMADANARPCVKTSAT